MLNGHAKTANGNGVHQADDMLPHNHDAEEALLGSLMVDSDSYYLISDMVSVEDFYTGKHRTIYECFRSLIAQGVTPDMITLDDELTRRDDGEMWISILSSLCNAVPTSINIQGYASIVSENATRRRMIRAAGKIATSAYDQTSHIDDQLADAESVVFGIRGDRAYVGIKKPRVYISEYLDEFQRLQSGDALDPGLQSGFRDLDMVLGGLQAPHQYVIAARPGMGKSALALGIVGNAVLRHRKRVAVFSLEMGTQQIVNRIIAGATGIDSRKLKRPGELTPDETKRVMEVAGRLSESYLFLDDSENATPSQIRAKCMRLYAEHGLDLVVIDHLHLMSPDRRLNRQDQEYGEISRSLAGLGKAVRAPVLTLAQLNRTVETRQNKRPMLSDLRESGGIEENAFCVMFLYREAYYDPMSDGFGNELIIAKNREGPLGTINLFWREHTATFHTLDRQPIAI
jgi:replicative DNA helicase